MSHLPPVIPLHEVARELRKSTHVLVSASSAGTFPPIVRVGAIWFVRQDLLADWFGRQHAPAAVTPLQTAWVRQAAETAACAPPSPHPRRPRARTASSS